MFWNLAVVVACAPALAASSEGPFKGSTATVAGPTDSVLLNSAPPGEEHPPAQPGFGADPITSLHGWQSKEPNTPEVALNALQGADLPQRLTALLGYNPFVLATVAGEVSVSRGIDPALATSLAASSGPEVYALVPALPLQQLYQKQLEQQGIKVLWPLMPNAYMIKATPAQVQQLAKDAKTYAITRVPPQLKLHDLLVRELNIAGFARASENDGRVVEDGKVNLALFDMADSKAVAAAVKALGGTVVKQDADINLLTCIELDAAAVLALAERSDIFFLEQATLPQAQLETSVALCGDHHLIRNNTTWQYGLTVSVGMIDSGCEINHNAFRGWNPYPALDYLCWNVSGEGSCTHDTLSGHGTHVAGILLSRWWREDLAGCAPWSGGETKSTFYYVRCSKDSQPKRGFFNTTQAMDHLGNADDALVINCSWGSKDASGSTSSSVKADGMVWNRNQIYVFSAGNSGPNAGTINSPGAAKNVIAVGNLYNPDLTLRHTSSRGPTRDGRVKPDIYAPGCSITSASANAANFNSSVDKCGTSMAAPHVTGVLATLLGHYPTAQRRPALARAYMMAQSDRAAFADTNNRGLLNSYEMHWNTARARGYWKYYDSDPTGYSYIYWDFAFPSDMARMYVVLNWIEPPVAVGTVNVVNNDVDLWVDREPYVDGPTGDWGSTLRGDNVEQVILNNPAGGNYRMKARRYSSSTNYRLGLGIRIELNTPTPTNTPSNTPSNTPTGIITTTPTSTSTPPTHTPSHTPTGIITATPTSTSTPPTHTPSHTPTGIITTTPTNTSTPPTHTPSHTPTGIITTTPTNTSTPPTHTPTNTPTNTVTPTTTDPCPPMIYYNEVHVSCAEPLRGGNFVFSLIPMLPRPVACAPVDCSNAYVSCLIDCTKCQDRPCTFGVDCIIDQIVNCINSHPGWWAFRIGPNRFRIEGSKPFDKCISAPEMVLPPGMGLPLVPGCDVNNICNAVERDELQPHVSGYDFHIIDEGCEPPRPCFNEVHISCAELMGAISPFFAFSLIPPVPTCGLVNCNNAYVSCTVSCLDCVNLSCPQRVQCVINSLLTGINSHAGWVAFQTGPAMIRIEGPVPFDKCISGPEIDPNNVGLGYVLKAGCDVNNVCNGIGGDEMHLHTSGYVFHVIDEDCRPKTEICFNEVHISCTELAAIGQSFIFSLILPAPPGYDCQPIDCSNAYLSCTVSCQQCATMLCSSRVQCIMDQIMACINAAPGWSAFQIGPADFRIEGPVPFDKCISGPEIEPNNVDVGYVLKAGCDVNNVCNGILGDEMQPHVSGYDFHVINEGCYCDMPVPTRTPTNTPVPPVTDTPTSTPHNTNTPTYTPAAPRGNCFNLVYISCTEPSLHGGGFVFSLIPKLPVDQPCVPISCTNAFVSCQVSCDSCFNLPCTQAVQCIMQQLITCINATPGWMAFEASDTEIIIEGPVPFDKCVWSPEMGLPIGTGLPVILGCGVDNVCNGVQGDELAPHANGYGFYVVDEGCDETPTPTDTAPPDLTATPTSTAIVTPTFTPTYTQPHLTTTPTHTFTNTATPSNTPTVAATRTPTNTIAIPTPIYTGRCECPRTPGVNDFDGDGLVDGAEAALPLGPGQTNRYLWDTDGDGLSDGLEAGMGLNPRARQRRRRRVGLHRAQLLGDQSA